MNRAANTTERSRHRRRLILLGLLVLFLLALGAAWRWTPLNEYLTFEKFEQLTSSFESPWIEAVAVVGILTVALSLMLPLTLMAIFAGIAFGGVLGFLYTVLAALASAVLVFALGRCIGEDAIKKIAGPRVTKVNDQLAGAGVVAVAIARLVPAAPFTVFNLIAGASQLTFRSFIIGSLLTLTPGIAAFAMFSGQVTAAFKDPSIETAAMGILFLVVIVTAVVLLKRRIKANG